MFEKIGRLAEAAATNVSVSRRGFFGQLGRGALVVAGALGGLPQPAEEAPPGYADVARRRLRQPTDLLPHDRPPPRKNTGRTAHATPASTASACPFLAVPTAPDRTKSMCWPLLTMPREAMTPRSSIRKANGVAYIW